MTYQSACCSVFYFLFHLLFSLWLLLILIVCVSVLLDACDFHRQCLVFLILLRLLVSSSVFSCITVFPLKAASIRLAFGSLHFFVFCLCISVFLFTALSKQLAIASINFFSKQPLAPVCPGRFSPHDSSLFQPVSHHISDISNKFHQLAN